MDAIDANKHVQQESGGAPPSLLTVILDTHPLCWAKLSQQHSLPLQTFIANLLVFVNAHLAFSTENRVAILAAHLGRSEWLFPIPEGDAPLPPPNANKYRPFAVVESSVLARLNQLLEHTTPEDIASADDTVPLAGPLTLALTYTNRVNISLSPNTGPADTAAAAPTSTTSQASALGARVLIVSVSAADLAAQYIPLTNAMFAAQHARVPIDVLKLAGDTALLQQAAFTTGGRYIAPEGLMPTDGKEGGGGAHVSLLPYLLHALLPDPAARAHLIPPTSPHVDFRAACFCHRRVVDMGFVCSICLSIFCKAEELPNMVCITCGTQLVLGGGQEDEPVLDGEGPKKRKKKKKKDGDGGDTPMTG